MRLSRKDMMRRIPCSALVAVALCALFAATSLDGEEATSASLVGEKESGGEGKAAQAPGETGLKLPAGLRAKEGTTPEPYSNSGLPKEVIHEKTGMEMVFIPAGEFVMGRQTEDYFLAGGLGSGWQTQHGVRITKPFYFGKYEVTQDEWQAVMGNNPSHFKSGRNPVEDVSWNDCQEFIAKAGSDLRLPTEAEWEYACRAGSTTRFSFGDSSKQLRDYAWYLANSGDKMLRIGDSQPDPGILVGPDKPLSKTLKTHPVGEKQPNAWGLFDMHGNVLEWCADWYYDKYYSLSPTDDPQGPVTGRRRVLRGGYYASYPDECCCATGFPSEPGQKSYNGRYGFRLAGSVFPAAANSVLATEPVTEAQPSNDDMGGGKTGLDSEGTRLRLPTGLKAKDGTLPEPYSNTGLPKEAVHEQTGIELIFIPAGDFAMGRRYREFFAPDVYEHAVRITKPFYLARYEVTNGQYRQWRLDHSSGSYMNFSLDGDRQPAVNVSWEDATGFARWAGLRLPTEAEWEYACRAGSKEDVWWGAGFQNAWMHANVADKTAWRKLSDRRVSNLYDDKHAVTAPVGTYDTNPFGLYDMIGNVKEWCADWYGEQYYRTSPTDDPKGPASGGYRVLRGGSWASFDGDFSSFDRSGARPDTKSIDAGFRLTIGME